MNIEMFLIGMMTGNNISGKKKMSDTITITWKDGTQWMIHRSILKTLTNGKLPVPNGFFEDQREIDILLLLGKMEEQGLKIDDKINATFR